MGTGELTPLHLSQVPSEATREELSMALPPPAVEKHQFLPLGAPPPDYELFWRGELLGPEPWVLHTLGKH